MTRGSLAGNDDEPSRDHEYLFAEMPSVDSVLARRIFDDEVDVDYYEVRL